MSDRLSKAAKIDLHKVTETRERLRSAALVFAGRYLAEDFISEGITSAENRLYFAAVEYAEACRGE